MSARIVKKKLSIKANRQTAKVCQRFFKTGIGEYAAGDIFIGVKMPEIRTLAKEHMSENLSEIQILLMSKIHEERMLALVILTLQFGKAYKLSDQDKMKMCFDFYIDNRKFINNWDLVDVTASVVVGAYLFARDRSILVKMVKSSEIWDRRIAIVATHYFIRRNDFADTLMLAEYLLNDDHDLIHKAVGWMLREVGKKDQACLLQFLDTHVLKMPRVMLRYAIEKLSPLLRKKFLSLR